MYHVGTVSRATDAKVAVYSCPFDAMATETKGTVLLKTASELKEFSQGEENLIEGVMEGGRKGGREGEREGGREEGRKGGEWK